MTWQLSGNNSNLQRTTQCHFLFRSKSMKISYIPRLQSTVVMLVASDIQVNMLILVTVHSKSTRMLLACQMSGPLGKVITFSFTHSCIFSTRTQYYYITPGLGSNTFLNLKVLKIPSTAQTETRKLLLSIK